jgi:hypothetical protein
MTLPALHLLLPGYQVKSLQTAPGRELFHSRPPGGSPCYAPNSTQGCGRIKGRGPARRFCRALNRGTSRRAPTPHLCAHYCLGSFQAASRKAEAHANRGKPCGSAGTCRSPKRLAHLLASDVGRESSPCGCFGLPSQPQRIIEIAANCHARPPGQAILPQSHSGAAPILRANRTPVGYT